MKLVGLREKCWSKIVGLRRSVGLSLLDFKKSVCIKIVGPRIKGVGLRLLDLERVLD